MIIKGAGLPSNAPLNVLDGLLKPTTSFPRMPLTE